MTDGAQPLWVPTPEAMEHSAVAVFSRHVEGKHGVQINGYTDLWHWSVEHLEDFWLAVWETSDIRSEQRPDQVLVTATMPGASWFPGVTLNYASHVFRDRDPDGVAVVEVTENGESKTVTWAELERRTAAVAQALRDRGVGEGDRVVGYLPNASAAIVSFLATASLGAVWSVCGQDYAPGAAADRLAQLEPTVLVCADGYHYGGRQQDRREEAVALSRLLPTVTSVLQVSHLGLPPASFDVPVAAWDEVLETAQPPSLSPVPVPFDHPLWVLYSSGTTGIPKGLVHAHGGVVLDNHKVNRLHLDMTSQDRLFWYTTTNWMMWNFSVSALVIGASLVAYDGSPAHPQPDQLWRLCAEHGVTVFGTSPGYLQASQRHGDAPARTHDLSALRLIGATGSPLATASYHWIHEQLGPSVPLMPMSGGTDIVSALAIGAPTVPVWPGEISCPALGVALDAYDESGHSVRDRVGELVITKPMPTMPVYLLNDADGRKYRDAYFDVYPGVWRHGDWVTITDRDSVVIHGRSDATLNRMGVRLGSADIYAIVEDVPGVLESLVVGIDLPEANYWMPLFVVLADGYELDEGMRQSISGRLRQQASPRHVPDEIIAVPAIPHTRTGKKLEVPIKRILAGADPSAVLSLGAVDDTTSLDAFVRLADARRKQTTS